LEIHAPEDGFFQISDLKQPQQARQDPGRLCPVKFRIYGRIHDDEPQQEAVEQKLGKARKQRLLQIAVAVHPAKTEEMYNQPGRRNADQAAHSLRDQLRRILMQQEACRFCQHNHDRDCRKASGNRIFTGPFLQFRHRFSLSSPALF